jgi:hypothetical protein
MASWLAGLMASLMAAGYSYLTVLLLQKAEESFKQEEKLSNLIFSTSITKTF